MTPPPQYEIKGFLETSFLDWPGQVAAVIFLAGCNFRCPFCHNHDLVLNPGDYPTVPWPEIRARLTKFKGWVDGVVLSGGEPTLSPGLEALILEIKKLGFKVKLDTNGSRPDVLKRLLKTGLLDHAAMDVKATLDETAYAQAAGRPGFLPRIMASLELLRSGGTPYTLRTTVVPTLHSEEDLLELADQLAWAPEWKLQNFNPEKALDPDFRNIEPLAPDLFAELTLKAMRRFGRAA